jgi:hypothetical protein
MSTEHDNWMRGPRILGEPSSALSDPSSFRGFGDLVDFPSPPTAPGA